MNKLLCAALGAFSLCAVAALPGQAAPMQDAVFHADSGATVETVQYRRPYGRPHGFHRHRYYRRHGYHRRPHFAHRPYGTYRHGPYRRY